MKNKGLRAAMGIALVVFAVMNLCLFLIIKERFPVFWISYVFWCLSWISMMGVLLSAGSRNNGDHALTHLPQTLVAVLYFFFDTVATLLMMTFQPFDLVICIVIQTIVLGVFATLLLGLSYYRDIQERGHLRNQNDK